MADGIFSRTTISTKQSPQSPVQKVTDFTCENHGSVFLLTPLSPAAFEWVEKHLPADRMTWGRESIVVDHHHIWAILDGLQNDGLTARPA